MKDISENLHSLRKIFSSTKTELRPRSDFRSLLLEDLTAAGRVQQKQIREDKIFTEVKDESWDTRLDNLITQDGENVLGNEVKREDGCEDGLEDNKLKGNIEGFCLMSSDVTKYQLQILEQQVQKENHSDLTCESPEVLNRNEF